MNHRLRVLGSFAIIIVARTFAQDPFHRSYTIEDGLPSDQVYCALQDRDGYMWFGTDAGVARFDGVEFTNLGPADGLSDNEVIGIHEDSAGRIWFLTLNGAVSFWWKGVVHNASTDAYLGRYRGRSGWSTFCEDKEGRLWFGGIRGDMMRLEPKNGEVIYAPPDFSLRSVIRDVSGAILFVSSGGIERFKGDRFETIHPVQPGWLINHITQPRSAGQRPIGLDATGVYEISVNGTSLLRGTETAVNQRLHRAALRDGTGNIWMCRKDEGIDLMVLRAEGFRPIEHQFGTYRINSIYITDEGDRWYCTANQGVMLVDRQVQGHTMLYETDRNSAAAFISIAGSAGRVWLGTDQGHVHSYANGRLVEAFRPDEGRLPGRILRIEPAPSGDVWFGTDWGLFRWDGSRSDLTLVTPVDSTNRSHYMTNAPAKAVMVAADGTVWSPGIGLWRNHAQGRSLVRYLFMPDKIQRSRLSAIAEDAHGTIWLADADRMLSLENDSLVKFHDLPGTFKGTRITDVIHLKGDTLAVATAGKGVLLLSGDRALGSLGTNDGLGSAMVRRLRYFGDTLWCATAQGVSAFRLEGAKPMESWTWNVQHGLPTNNVYDVFAHGDQVLMATGLGLCIAPPRPTRIDRPAPKLILAHLAINDSLVAPANTQYRLNTDDRVRVDVHALEFANAALVRYEYAVDREGSWSSCAEGRVIIEGLSEGPHVIRVRARILEGAWTGALSVPLVVRPLWWASNLAKFAVAFGGLALLLLVLFYWSRRGFHRKLERVRATVALNEERRRIAADVHDDLGADLSRVLMHARRLEAIAPDGNGASVSQGISATIDKIDEIIWSLDPRRDTLRSTVHFIEQQAREMAEAHGLSYRTLVELPEGDVPLPAAERREVMLIAREALRNVVEHARASTMRVEWRVEGASLRMVVQDDGVGIGRPLGTTDRSGLHNMRQRAERLGGTLDIGPAEPHGTKVELRMMLKSNHQIG